MRFDSMAFPHWSMPAPWTIGPGDEYATSININDSNDFVICSTITGVDVSEWDYSITIMGEFWLFKYSNTFGGLEVEETYSAIPTLDQGYIIDGHTTGEGPANSSVYIVKIGHDCLSPGPVVNTVGIKDEAMGTAPGTLSVFPNPSNGDFYLVPSAEWLGSPMELQVLDVSGRLVYKSSITEFSEGEWLEVDLRGMPPGVYILNCKNPLISSCSKLIVY
jgi:hypothetical protein